LGLAVANTWFKKSDNLKVTYKSGGCRSVVDYVLVRKGDRTMVSDGKAITNEACVPQHKVLICVVRWRDQIQKRRETYVSKCKVWKLRDERKRKEFQTKLITREADRVNLDVETMWQDFKKCLSEVAEEVCEKTK